MSSGYSGSSGLSEVIASAMSMRRLFIAQSDDEVDDDAVDSHWEDYSILIVLVYVPLNITCSFIQCNFHYCVKCMHFEVRLHAWNFDRCV